MASIQTKYLYRKYRDTRLYRRDAFRIRDQTSVRIAPVSAIYRKVVERQEGTIVGPQSDHTLGSRLEAHGTQGPIGWLQDIVGTASGATGFIGRARVVACRLDQ